MDKLYFIVNVAARNGKSILVWHKLLELLEKGHVAYDVFFTEYRGHAAELAEMIAMEKKDVAAIIAVGGDGTIHEVVNGVVRNVGKKIKIGYICAGSGNDFARGYEIPKSPKAALAFILENIEYSFPSFDIGLFTADGVKQSAFVSSLGIGFDAEVSKVANESGLKRILNFLHLGFLTYVFILLKVLFTYKCKTVSIKIDEREQIFERVWFITISNQPYYGGGMKISPAANPFDGILNITVVHKLSRLKLLAIFLTVFWGGHNRFKEVKTMVGKSIEINSDEKMLIHADGEIVGYSPLKTVVKVKQACYISSLMEKEGIDIHPSSNVQVNS